MLALSMVTLVIGYLAGHYGLLGRFRRGQKLLESPKSQSSRIHGYLFLLENDADNWKVESPFFTGWMRYSHPTGLEIRLYKKDGDIETETYSSVALSAAEKKALREAVAANQNMKAINEIIG